MIKYYSSRFQNGKPILFATPALHENLVIVTQPQKATVLRKRSKTVKEKQVYSLQQQIRANRAPPPTDKTTKKEMTVVCTSDIS